jgi:hypothetical protein
MMGTTDLFYLVATILLAVALTVDIIVAKILHDENKAAKGTSPSLRERYYTANVKVFGTAILLFLGLNRTTDFVNIPPLIVVSLLLIAVLAQSLFPAYWYYLYRKGKF